MAPDLLKSINLSSTISSGNSCEEFAFGASGLEGPRGDSGSEWEGVWHHLIDLCVLTRTLVVDAARIYDPRQLNDRLLLGLKGTMREFQPGLLCQRAQETHRQKAMRGDVMTRVPVVQQEGKGRNDIAWIWQYSKPGGLVRVDYQDSRSHAGPSES